MVCPTNGFSKRDVPPPMTTTLNLSLVAVLANRTCRAAPRERRVSVWALNICGCKSRRNEGRISYLPRSFDQSNSWNRKNGEIIWTYLSDMGAVLISPHVSKCHSCRLCDTVFTSATVVGCPAQGLQIQGDLLLVVQALDSMKNMSSALRNNVLVHPLPWPSFIKSCDGRPCVEVDLVPIEAVTQTSCRNFARFD